MCIDTLAFGASFRAWNAAYRCSFARIDDEYTRIATCMVLLLLRYAKGCTTVVVNATDGGTVIGRTMELGIPLPERASNNIWSLVTRSSDEKRFGYAAISAALGGATSDAFVVEGMNEKGFTVSVNAATVGLRKPHNARPATSYIRQGRGVFTARARPWLTSLQRCAAIAVVDGRSSRSSSGAVRLVRGRRKLHFRRRRIPRGPVSIHDNSRGLCIRRHDEPDVGDIAQCIALAIFHGTSSNRTGTRRILRRGTKRRGASSGRRPWEPCRGSSRPRPQHKSTRWDDTTGST